MDEIYRWYDPVRFRRTMRCKSCQYPLKVVNHLGFNKMAMPLSVLYHVWHQKGFSSCPGKRKGVGEEGGREGKGVRKIALYIPAQTQFLAQFNQWRVKLPPSAEYFSITFLKQTVFHTALRLSKARVTHAFLYYFSRIDD